MKDHHAEIQTTVYAIGVWSTLCNVADNISLKQPKAVTAGLLENVNVLTESKALKDG